MSATYVLASGNKGKLAEFNALFNDLSIKVIPQAEYDIDDAEETGSTFVENAIIKARHASSKCYLPALADDSGLVVPALDGKPGIYSARFAGTHGDNAANNKKLLKEMVGKQNRNAFFICVLVLMRSADDPSPLICQAKWHGEIATGLSGTQGFGYDPLFYLPSENCTAAELDKSVKNAISHRAKALKQLLSQLPDWK
ncbi:MAG: RdgB/HAM1 family non-canonical purine NTP pyrophosphatase [Pseudomonadota bacterium]